MNLSNLKCHTRQQFFLPWRWTCSSAGSRAPVRLHSATQLLVQPILDCGATLRHVHLCESNAHSSARGTSSSVKSSKLLAKIEYDHFASVKVCRGATLEEAARSSIEYLRRVGV